MVTATIYYPIHLELTGEQKDQYLKLPEYEREDYLLNLADERYISQGSADPFIESVSVIDESEK